MSTLIINNSTDTLQKLYDYVTYSQYKIFADSVMDKLSDVFSSNASLVKSSQTLSDSVFSYNLSNNIVITGYGDFSGTSPVNWSVSQLNLQLADDTYIILKGAIKLDQDKNVIAGTVLSAWDISNAETLASFFGLPNVLTSMQETCVINYNGGNNWSGLQTSGSRTFTDGCSIKLQYQINFITVDGNRTTSGLGVEIYLYDSNENLVLQANASDYSLTGNPGYDAAYRERFFGGSDLIQGTNLADSIDSYEGNDTVSSGIGDDSISGGVGDDSLDGGEGNDSLGGDEGVDAISGGIGADTLEGGAGIDNISGGTGDDSVSGGDGADDLTGDTGTDTIDGGAGNDVISAGDDADTVTAGTGDDSVSGGEGADDLAGGIGADTLDGGAGDDVLYSGDGNDNVSAGEGADLIIGGDGAGDDTYDGGTGADTVKYTSAVASITVNLVIGTATSTAGNDAAGIGTDKLTNIENIIAGNYADSLVGSTEANVITGSAGNDSIDGGLNTDTAVYLAARTNYTVTETDSGFTVINITGTDGTDKLVSIERLQFTDQAIAFDADTSNSAGGIYRLYKAALDRNPDLGGLGYWIAQADAGTKDAVRMATDFTYADEFKTLYGVQTADNYMTGEDITALVTKIYENVLDRAPDAGGRDYYAGQITAKSKTVGQVLAEISDSAENNVNRGVKRYQMAL